VILFDAEKQRIFMKLTLGKLGAVIAAASALLFTGGQAAAAAFDSGSNGSYGAMSITENTVLDLPPDGIFHCTTITVAQSRTLSFRRNPLNTPVVLLATSNVVINGVIDVSGSRPGGAIPGAGGPGGFDGGYGGLGPVAPANQGSDGHGPGRGRYLIQQISAVYAQPFQQNSNVYGNVLIVPLIGGSGGGGSGGNPGEGGGGGGGAILIASSTSIIINNSGGIRAVGAYSQNGGYGSGGAVRLVAPTGGGAGYIDARTEFNTASPGRIRIDTENIQAFRNLSYYGTITRGNRMFVFPASTPKLHIVEAAGQAIPVGTGNAVTVNLPAGTPATQTVKIRGEGFTGTVPIRLVVVPEHSTASDIDLNLNAGNNPAEVSAQITIPVGEITRIEAWTR